VDETTPDYEAPQVEDVDTSEAPSSVSAGGPITTIG
jgi:hypothetical protein